MSRARLHIHYSGRVQGVGFRYTVKSLITGFEVVGTIRNLPDGRVELVAEGERAELEAFRQAVIEVRDQAIDIGFFRNRALGFMRVEIAIRTFADAPGDVDVERQRRQGGQRYSSGG